MHPATCLRLTLLLAALAAGGRLHAETFEELSSAINATAGRQMDLINQGRERSERLARELAGGAHDTPEMKETRARIQRLRTELADAEQTLRTQFEALPGFRDEVRKTREEQAEVRQLDARRQELLNRRQALLDKTKPAADKPRANP